MPFIVDTMELSKGSSPLKLSQYDIRAPMAELSAILSDGSAADLPLQLKSLSVNTWEAGVVQYDWYEKKLITATEAVTKGLTWNSLASFILNFMTIAKVEVLVGFEPHLNEESPFYGRPKMNVPVWKILDETHLKEVTQVAAGGSTYPSKEIVAEKFKPALCRLSPYVSNLGNDAEYKYEPNKFLQLPIYNRYFMIQY